MGFQDECLATFGWDKFENKVKLDNEKEIKLVIWDTPGQKRFRSYIWKNIGTIDGIIFVFDISTVIH